MSDFDPLSNMTGAMRAMIASRALCKGSEQSAPTSWLQTVRWVEEYGYVPWLGEHAAARDPEVAWFQRVIVDESQVRWLTEMSLAAGLYHFERYERTRRLYTLPEKIRVPVVLRFEEIRALVAPPSSVSSWAVELQAELQSEMRLGSRLPMYAFFASAFAMRAPRFVRFILRKNRVDERQVMSRFSPAPDEFREWFIAVIGESTAQEVRDVR